MPGRTKISQTVSAATYQSFDGSNFTVVGTEAKFKKGNFGAGIFGGLGTNFETGNVFVNDLKASYNYGGNGIFNQNLRLRSKISDDTHITQIRYSPFTVDVPVGGNVDVYLNTHYSGTYNYDTNKMKHSIGAFAGATYSKGNFNISAEVQRYNLQDLNDNSGQNWSGNIILGYKF